MSKYYTDVLKERFVSDNNSLKDIKFISDCERFYLPNELFLNPMFNNRNVIEKD
ncbi:MAG: hypothetical protein HQ463_09195 [Bacteroidetes bacterium]|nr:hypothetical protein [Bacteroidota bacterium]